jgi:hypothetical protein
MGVALVRIGHGLGWWQVSRGGLLVAHFHLGLAGFGTLTAVGMATRMLPAFLKATPADEAAALRVIGWAMSAGLLLLSAGAIWRLAPLLWPGGVLMLLATVVHLRLLTGYWRRRTVKSLDPALGFVGAAITWLAVTAGWGLWMLVARPFPGRAWAAYAVVGLVGWLAHLIVGVLHRIGPRLVANQRAAGGRPRPEWLSRGELRAPMLSWGGLAAMSAGTATMALAIALGLPDMARLAAIAVWVGVLAVTLQGWLVSR